MHPEFLACVHENGLHGWVVAEIDEGEQVVHSVVIQPEPPSSNKERILDSPISRRVQLGNCPIPGGVAHLYIHAMLRVVVHQSHGKIVYSQEPIQSKDEAGTLNQPPALEHRTDLQGEQKLRHCKLLVAFQELHRVCNVVAVEPEHENHRVNVRQDPPLQEVALDSGVCYEEGVGALEVVIPRCVGVHVVLQIVLAVPTIRAESNAVQGKVGPKLVVWLMTPIVAKRS
mmetsp:Transcript_64509/g.135383  ORF Transcript_64509/g.135383 Transcript_64509/m.135383 type:complete len:228 (+) Transcript_64509:385-1068(+)